ncbi:MAG: response regulator [Deferribacteres bacterium]|nr:response regulator [candidate division KSB1 bacterium]MCB9502503.1 response regulator [Deferribacteres bacterium]
MNNSKQTILIVDSNPESAMFFDVNLSRFGYAIQVARSSEEAWQLANSATPSLVISEFSIKPQDGIDFCWMMRQTKYLRAVPFILLTTQSHIDEIKLRAFRHGVDDILQLPVSLRALAGRIETLIWRFDQLVHTDPVTTSLTYDDSEPSEVPLLQGNLQSFNVLEILQFLNMNKKSGTLEVHKDEQTGFMTLKKGEVKYAEIDEHYGEEAMYRLAIWRDGIFKFSTKIGDQKDNIEKATMKLILDCCTVLDMENFMVKM